MKRVVVIEDDPDVTAVLKDLFQTMGFEADFFISGEQAIPRITATVPDIVIMDLMMPTMSGFEICSQLKSSSKTKDIPLIAVTGYDSQENRRKIFLAGINDYLPKPFELMALLKKIESLTNK